MQKEHILHINTALEHAMVGISRGDVVLCDKRNTVQMEHASFVHPAIKDMMAELSIKWHNIKAVSIINGPGSYTGLRVGLAAAKGICYTWKLPIIPLTTLEWLAYPFMNGDHDVLIPMIDARRMEVFTAVYSGKLEKIEDPHALILDEESYQKHLNKNQKVLFTGNGTFKLPESIKSHENVSLKISPAGIQEQAFLCREALKKNHTADIAYLEPFYLKDFHTSAQIIKK